MTVIVAINWLLARPITSF